MKSVQRHRPDALALAGAFSRLVGAYLGIFGLGITFLAGTISGTGLSASALRAVLVALLMLVTGRVVGWFLGRALAASPELEAAPPRAEAEGGS
jgi:multisubunit Na+/H+ antiporter MnhG subunit